jgi:hypothetical protein
MPGHGRRTASTPFGGFRVCFGGRRRRRRRRRRRSVTGFGTCPTQEARK